jgi:rhodanese-related sulfurtransferase
MALLGVAALCAVIANGLAGPERRLAWTVAPPTAAAPIKVPPPPQPLAIPTPEPRPSAASASKPPDAARPDPAPPKGAFPPRPGQPLREIGPLEALDAFSAGAPFLDARRSAEYELGHIQGAWSLPLWESTLDERLTEFEAKANPSPEAALVLYCSGGSCEDSHLLASRLFQLGYRNLLIYRDGYPDWVAQGRPIAKGAVR